MSCESIRINMLLMVTLGSLNIFNMFSAPRKLTKS
jgi:hypothetical protein